MSLLTPQLVSAFFLGLETRFNQAFKAAQPRGEAISTLVGSDTEAEIQAWMARSITMRKWVAERVLNDLSSRAQKLVNEPWEASFKVPRAKIADDKSGIFQPAMDELGRAAKLWRDKLTFAALLAGNSTLCFDGQNYFDDSHPQNMDTPGSPVQSNLFTTKPLTSDNLAEVVATMGAYKGEDGESMEVEPNLLVVGPDLRKQAKRILNAEIIATTAGTASESNVMQGDMDVLVTPKLSGGMWFAMDTTRPIKPLLFQLREEPTFDYLINSSDPNVFFRDEYVCGVKARGAAGYGPWWLAARCTP